MTYFDTTLEFAPIAEQQNTPVLPEERFVFELIGFERSQPDQYRPEGGIKWTWLVWTMDGQRFIFNDEHYQFFRTTGLTRDGKPNFNIGTYANEWASAMLGRELGVDANFSVSELRGKKMSAMVVWENQKSDPKKKTIKLASLRHVPVGDPSPAPPSRAQVEADATVEDVDRALALAKFEKKLERAKKKKLPSLAKFQAAYDEIYKADAGQIDALTESLDDALDKLDD